MRTFLLMGVLLFVVMTWPARAGEQRVIELTDGSTLAGEVLSLGSGVYTIKSPSLGTIQIEESKIRAIRSGAPSAPQAAGASPGDATALQEKMLGNRDVMNMILTLQNDPDFRKVLENPEIMKAVQAGDAAALQSHPDFIRLLNNATVRDIQKKVQ